MDRRMVTEQTVGLLLHVEEGEGGEFGAAHRGGVAEQDDHGIADIEGRGASRLLRICRTVSDATGSAAPCIRWTCRIAVQSPSSLDTAIPSAARCVR